MTSDRRYHKALSLSAARQQLQKAAGTQGDAQVVMQLLPVLPDGRITVATWPAFAELATCLFARKEVPSSPT